MIRLRQKIVSLMRRLLPVTALTVAIVGMAMAAWGSTTTSVTWTTKEDFENNAVTTGTPTTRLNIDTTTSPGDGRTYDVKPMKTYDVKNL